MSKEVSLVHAQLPHVGHVKARARARRPQARCSRIRAARTFGICSFAWMKAQPALTQPGLPRMPVPPREEGERARAHRVCVEHEAAQAWKGQGGVCYSHFI